MISSTAHLFLFILVGIISGVFPWRFLPTKDKETFASALKDVFNRSHLSSCDLTANSCDINCCSDKDCSSSDVGMFYCQDVVVQDNMDPFIFDSNYCYTKLPPDLYPVNPIFCYELENSPYLGDFFIEDSVKLARIEVDQIIKERQPVDRSLKKKVIMEELDLNYKYGMPILILNKETASSEVFFMPGDILGKGYCSDSVPIRYFVNKISKCLVPIREESCGTNLKLNMHIFLKGRLSILHLLSGPSRNPVKITVKTSCLSNGTAYIQSKNLEYNYDMVDKIQPVCNERSEMAFYNKTTGFCENVIVKVNYDFKVVPGQITELTITFVLTSVPLRQSYFTQNKKRDENTDLYLFQSYSVQFNPLESKTFAPNGYHLEEQILLYNISSEDDECTGSNKCKNKPASTKHTVWTKVGGENCDEETLVTFGYNVMKTCLIRFESELTCEEQRKAILKILDNYLNFNAVDDGFGNAIPHIREGCTDRASSELDLETNSTECRIPKGIQFRALYSPVRNRSARFKIVGFHSNLWTGKCTPTMCHLSWSISFSEAKPRSLQSRWMEYMLSPIGSSYSWANLLSHNLNLESQRIDKFGTQGFRLILVLAFIVIILRFDY